MQIFLPAYLDAKKKTLLFLFITVKAFMDKFYVLCSCNFSDITT